MNRIPLDAFNNICLFLDAKSLANLSAVDRSKYFFLQDAAAWGPSALKPRQAITSKDKIASCFQAFLGTLTVDQPSRFFVVSPNSGIQLRIDVFCSKGNPILAVRDFNPNWRVPNEHGPSDTGASRNCQRAFTYDLPQRPELNMAWGEYHNIGFSGPGHFTAIGADESNPNENFVTFLLQSVEQRIDQLKANEERRLIQTLQELPADSQEQFIVQHNAHMIGFEALQDRVEQGARLAQGRLLRNNRSNTCTQTALKVAMAVAVLSFVVGFNFR